MSAAGKTATLDITPGDMCNLECKHCYAASSEGGGHGDDRLMNETQVRNVIHNLAELGVDTIDIAGGEPLLAFDRLVTAIETFKEIVPEGRAGIVTNATLLDSEKIERLQEAGIDSINLSFEGVTAEINDQVRGQGHFEAATGIANRIAESEMHLGVSITVNALNKHQASEFVPFGEDLGADAIAFQVIEPRGRAPDYWDELGISIIEGLEALTQAFHRYSTMHIDMPGPHRYLEFLNTYFNANLDLGEGRCPGGKTGYVVTSGGDIAPCPLYTYVLEKEVHSVTSSNPPLSEIERRYLDFSHDIDARSKKLEPCHECEYNDVCTHCPVNDDVVRECDWVERKRRELEAAMRQSTIELNTDYETLDGGIEFAVETQNKPLYVDLDERVLIQAIRQQTTVEGVLGRDTWPLGPNETVELFGILRSHGVVEIEDFWEPFSVSAA